MIRRKYVVLSLLTLVSIVLGGLLYSISVHAQTTVTSYKSVPAAAFVPGEDGYDWRNVGVALSNYETSGDSIWYASVELPHGATITNLTSYWGDHGSLTVSCALGLYNQTWWSTMARADSPGPTGPGDGSSYDDTIGYATVDNNKYAYLLCVMVPAPYTDYHFGYAVIKYTLPSEGAVGGLYIPVDKLSLLAPYIALVSTIIVAISISVAYIKYSKKQ